MVTPPTSLAKREGVVRVDAGPGSAKAKSLLRQVMARLTPMVISLPRWQLRARISNAGD